MITGDDEKDDIILEVRERKWRQNSLEVCACIEQASEHARGGAEGWARGGRKSH